MPNNVTSAEQWQILTDAINAGCPVPKSVYLNEDGAYVRVTTNDPADVLTWAHHFGIPTITTRIVAALKPGRPNVLSISAEGGRPLLSVAYLVDASGPEAEDEYPILPCIQCGRPMVACLPIASVFPGEPMTFTRPYHCPPCDRVYELDVTDTDNHDHLWLLANTAPYNLYPQPEAAHSGAA